MTTHARFAWSRRAGRKYPANCRPYRASLHTRENHIADLVEITSDKDAERANVLCCAGFWTLAITRLLARSAVRRPKSAKARSRGKLGPGWAAALWGFDVSDDLDGGCNTARKRSGCVDR